MQLITHKLINMKYYYPLCIIFVLLSTPAFSQTVELTGNVLVELVNDVRNKNSLVSVTYNHNLEKAAKIQAEYLSTLDDLYNISHVHPVDSLERVWNRIGVVSNDTYFNSSENITVFTVEEVPNDTTLSNRSFRNFITSQGHRTSILSDTESIFSGIQKTYSYGQCILYVPSKKWVIVVQVFATSFED